MEDCFDGRIVQDLRGRECIKALIAAGGRMLGAVTRKRGCEVDRGVDGRRHHAEGDLGVVETEWEASPNQCVEVLGHGQERMGWNALMSSRL